MSAVSFGLSRNGPHRPATPDDGKAMAELVNMAGDGLPLYLWTRMAEGSQSPWDVGRQRAQRETGAFSYRNAVVRDDGERVAAVLIGYPLPDEPGEVDDDMPAMFVPLQELENLAAGTWYVNVLAVYPEYRGRGFGTDLLEIAERLSADTGRRGLSLVVSDANAGALRLYERFGFVERARRPIVKESWSHAGESWVLMTTHA
jgi:ribosomal protein S18 acetylase RimI-like enzyme